MRVLLLCIIQSGFESSMYIFVFNWTPTLEFALANNDETSMIKYYTPHGLIFALMMICLMVGSQIYRIQLNTEFSSPWIFTSVLLVSALSLALPIIQVWWFTLPAANFIISEIYLVLVYWDQSFNFSSLPILYCCVFMLRRRIFISLWPVSWSSKCAVGFTSPGLVACDPELFQVKCVQQSWIFSGLDWIW